MGQLKGKMLTAGCWPEWASEEDEVCFPHQDFERLIILGICLQVKSTSYYLFSPLMLSHLCLYGCFFSLINYFFPFTIQVSFKKFFGAVKVFCGED